MTRFQLFSVLFLLGLGFGLAVMDFNAATGFVIAMCRGLLSSVQ